MIGLRLPKDLLRKFNTEAKKENRKAGPMAVEIVRRYFEQKEKHETTGTSKVGKEGS